MAKILFIYSTTDGHTIKICERLLDLCIADGHQVKLVSITDVAGVDLNSFDKIVIGASIRYGKHNPLVKSFIDAHQDILEKKISAFFSVNVVARKPEKNTPETNPYLKKFLQQIKWQPKNLAVFAGRLDYPKYGFFDRLMIRLIMLITDGPTAPDTVVEFTDWQKVDEFGRFVSAL